MTTAAAGKTESSTDAYTPAKEQPIFTSPGLTVLPKSLDEAAEVLAGYVASQEYWLILCDGHGFPITESILRKFYWDAPHEDMFTAVCPFKGVTLCVIVMRRRRMLARQYKYELSKQGVLMTERELVEGRALIRVASFNREKAREFGKLLDLETKADEMAVEA